MYDTQEKNSAKQLMLESYALQNDALAQSIELGLNTQEPRRNRKQMIKTEDGGTGEEREQLPNDRTSMPDERTYGSIVNDNKHQ